MSDNKIIVSKEKFCGVDAVKITNGDVELVVVTGVGPRIVAFNKVGKKNLFYSIENDYKTRSNDYKFYGGHRLWYSPEDAVRSYLPDNGACECELLSDGVVVSRKEELTGIERVMQIQLSEEGRVRVIHTIKNNSLFPVKCAPWAITQMRKGGVAVLPQETHDAGYLSNRTVSLWTYTQLSDKRFDWTRAFAHITQTSDSQPLKIGLLNDRGFIGYFVDGELFTKEFDLFDAEYPDGNVNSECYTNDKFLELETLGAYSELPVGEESVHTEVWAITENAEYKKDDEYLDAIFEKATKC